MSHSERRIFEAESVIICIESEVETTTRLVAVLCFGLATRRSHLEDRSRAERVEQVQTVERLATKFQLRSVSCGIVV